MIKEESGKKKTQVTKALEPIIQKFQVILWIKSEFHKQHFKILLYYCWNFTLILIVYRLIYIIKLLKQQKKILTATVGKTSNFTVAILKNICNWSLSSKDLMPAQQSDMLFLMVYVTKEIRHSVTNGTA